MRFITLFSCLVTIGLANATSKLVPLPEPYPAFGDQASPKGERFDFGGKMKLLDISTPKVPNTFAMVDDEDYERVSQWKWHPLFNNGNIYAVRDVQVKNGNSASKRKIVRLHRFILNPSPSLAVDHKDGNGLNNQKSNIRICTSIQNHYNYKKQKNSFSIYKGVQLEKRNGKFCCKITFDNNQFWVGTFTKEHEAGLAYNIMASILFGEFCRLNVISKGEA